MFGGLSRGVQQGRRSCVVVTGPGVTQGVKCGRLLRTGYSEEAIKALRKAFRTLFRKGLNVPQALEEMEAGEVTEEVGILMEFARTTKRGLCPGPRGGARDEE